MNFLIGLIGFGLVTSISSINISNSYTNSVGTEISNDKIETLKQLGFDEDEIDNLSLEKYNKFSNIELVETYVKSDCKVENEELSFNRNTMLSSDESYIDSDGSKEMTTYVSKYRENNLDKVFIKQKVVWNKVPKKRYSDILTISYSSNVMLKAEDGYCDVEMSLSYDETKYSKVGYKYKTPKYKEKTEINTIKNIYTGKDKAMYNHELGKYFAFKFDLPSDSYVNNSTKRYYAIGKTTYSNIKISLESTFVSLSSDNIGAAFQSHYVHQSGKGNFDWGKITFTNTAPFIIYNTTLWENDPSYDEALFNDFNVYF